MNDSKFIQYEKIEKSHTQYTQNIYDSNIFGIRRESMKHPAFSHLLSKHTHNLETTILNQLYT